MAREPGEQYIRKTDRQIQAEVNEIGRLLAMGMIDEEVKQKLQLKHSQYYSYRRKLFSQHAKQFEQGRMSDLAYHKQILHDRLTKVYRELEISLTLRDPQTHRPFIESRDVAPTALAMQNVAINLFKLESEGLRILQEYYGINANPRLIPPVPRSIGDNNGERLQVLSTTTNGATRGGETGLQAPIINANSEPDESEIY